MPKYNINWSDFANRHRFVDLKSRAGKNNTAEITYNALSYFAGCNIANDEIKSLNISSLLNYYIPKYNIIIDFSPNEKLNKLLTNIKDYIEAAPNKDKDKLKSFVTEVFTRNELREYGINIGKDKFRKLKKYKENLAANLRDDKVI
jgi:hypothetical protein